MRNARAMQSPGGLSPKRVVPRQALRLLDLARSLPAEAIAGSSGCRRGESFPIGLKLDTIPL